MAAKRMVLGLDSSDAGLISVRKTEGVRYCDFSLISCVGPS